MSVALVARVFDTQANQSFDVTFERFPVRLGRNQINDLHIDRPYVSQFHAAIEVRDRQIVVRDLGSTNGTIHAGKRLQRDAPVDITMAPELSIGPVVIRFGLVAATPKPREEPREGTVLDFGSTGAAVAALSQRKPIAPGAEDPYLRQLVPYLEAYRAAWGAVYRVVYDHLARLPPEHRQNYLKRLGLEHGAATNEPDFQKLAKYYGVDLRQITELGPREAALAAMNELAQTLAPTLKPLEDVGSVLHFARQLRDTMAVFMRCFVSLREGQKEFEVEVLGREDRSPMSPVAAARDPKDLGSLLLNPPPNVDAARELHEIFADIMSHQVGMISGVTEGVKALLQKMSPRALEDELDRKGKKGGLFSSRYEELWRLYELKHGDFGEEKALQRAIFVETSFEKGFDHGKAAPPDPARMSTTGVRR